MKALSVLLLAVSLLATARAQGEECSFGCAAVEEPVCGYLRGVHRTFSSACSMELFLCHSKQPWRKVADCACVDDPNKPTDYPIGK